MNTTLLFALAAVVAAFAMLLMVVLLCLRWLITNHHINMSLALYIAMSATQQTVSLVWVQSLYNDPSMWNSRAPKEWAIIGIISAFNVLSGTFVTWKAAMSQSASKNGNGHPGNLPPAQPWERPPTKTQADKSNETNPKSDPAGGSGAGTAAV